MYDVCDYVNIYVCIESLFGSLFDAFSLRVGSLVWGDFQVIFSLLC